MTREAFTAWLAAYEQAWRTAGTDGLGDLFTEDVLYRMTPYDPGVRGLDALAALWERERDGPDEHFTMAASVLAVEGDTGVARLEVRYPGHRVEDFRDLWVVRFADDGRCAEFEEWPYWAALAQT